MKVISAIAVALLLTGCLSVRPRGERPGASALVIPDVPVRTWGDNTCGSGALATVLNRYSDPVTEKELDSKLDKGLHGGVVSVDLLIEARRRGYDAELLPGSKEAIIRSLAAGEPVILMLRVVDLPKRRNDLFHYIVIDGIDRERDLFRMQFGRGKPVWARLEAVERGWRATQRATLFVHGRSASVASVDDQIKRAVVLQERGNHAGAISLYEQILARAPDSALAHTNLADAYRASGDRTRAEVAYRRAIALDEENRDALNNLAWLLFEEKRHDEAVSFARRAANLTGPDSQYIFDTLGEIEAALGNCKEARSAFERALEVLDGRNVDELTPFRSKLQQLALRCGVVSKE